MDQLKPVIEFFKKQYFWVLIGLVTLMSIASFVMTKMSLSNQLKQNTAALDTKYNSVKEVSSKASTHPNSASHEKMDAIAGKLAEDVGKAWELQYNRQVKLMEWPANELGQDFVDRIEKYRPIESLTFPLPSGQDPLGLPLRERYRDYVDPLFPRLAKIIGANWSAATKDLGGGNGGGMTGMGGEGGPGAGGYGSMMGGLTGGSGGAAGVIPIGPKFLVNWDDAAQKQLMQNVLWWHNANKAPSTLEILYTQEDLWILEGLMNIIKSTNGDAQENFQAAIKKIEYIRIGKQAVGRAGEISGIASTSSMTGGMASGMPGMNSGDMEGAMAGGSSGGGMPDPGAAVGPKGGSSGGGGGEEGGEGAVAAAGPPDPASGRYVDTAFQPIEGEKLRSVVTSGALDPTDAPLAVAKRVPVRMRFIMDQRKVNRLLAECGNADLMLEIRQVRINTTAAAAAGGGMGGMGGLFSGGGSPSASGMGGPSSSSSGGSASADMGESEGMMGMLGGGGFVTGSAKSYDLPVEIWGVVYMFNPVDMNKLGLQNVTAETQLDNVGRVDAADSTAPTVDPAAAGNAAGGTVQPAAETPAAPSGADPNAAASGEPAAPAAPGAPAASSPSGETPAAGAPAAGAPAAGDGGAAAGAAQPAGAGSATAPGT